MQHIYVSLLFSNRSDYVSLETEFLLQENSVFAPRPSTAWMRPPTLSRVTSFTYSQLVVDVNHTYETALERLV